MEAIEAIGFSLIAAIIFAVFIPQDIRKDIINSINSVVFIIFPKKNNNSFKVVGIWRNKKNIDRYFDRKIMNLNIKVIDFRKYVVKKNLKKMFPDKYKDLFKKALIKMENQKKQYLNSVKYLLLDESSINLEIYRKKYDYCDLLLSILQYSISKDEDTNKDIKIRFYYEKTKRNKLPREIELIIRVDENFLKKYKDKVCCLYFDYEETIKNLNFYKAQENFNGWTEEEILNYLESNKRNNMDIFDLEMEDYIKYIAPQFYTNISIIAEGEWIYSKLDIKYYMIDHFQFDLKELSKLCKGIK